MYSSFYTPVLVYFRIGFLLSFTIVLLDNGLMLSPSIQTFLIQCNCVSRCIRHSNLHQSNCALVQARLKCRHEHRQQLVALQAIIIIIIITIITIIIIIIIKIIKIIIIIKIKIIIKIIIIITIIIITIIIIIIIIIIRIEVVHKELLKLIEDKLCNHRQINQNATSTDQ